MDYFDYVFSEQYKESQDREAKHRLRCYGTNCMSCSCDRLGEFGAAKPCTYHKGADSYRNELLERIAVAQEKLSSQ